MPINKYSSMQEIDIQYDAIDEYHECIMACTISEDGVQCIAQCIDSHLEKGVQQ